MIINDAGDPVPVNSIQTITEDLSDDSSGEGGTQQSLHDNVQDITATRNDDTRKRYASSIRYLTKKVMPNDHPMDDLSFFIDRYDQVCRFIDTRSLQMIRWYANVISDLIPNLPNFGADVKELFSRKYGLIRSEAMKRIRHRKNPPRVVEPGNVHRDIEAYEGYKLEELKQQFPDHVPSRWSENRARERLEEFRKKHENMSRSEMNEALAKLLQQFDLAHQKAAVLTERFMDPEFRDYKQKTLKFFKTYLEGVYDLEILLKTELIFPIFHRMVKDKVGDSSILGYYSALKFYVEFQDSNPDEIHRVLHLYTHKLLPKLPSQKDIKHRPKELEKDYMNYRWPELRKRVHSIIKNESKNDLHNLLMSLYCDAVVRRTSDYTRMVINIKDDADLINVDKHKNNVLIFNDTEKKFIFNYWKNKNKVGSQELKIKNERLIKTLKSYLSKHPKNRYLLELGGKPMVSRQVTTQMQTIKKKYNIPFKINSLRHMLASHCRFVLKFDDHDMHSLAKEMGTSFPTIQRHYLDYDQHVKQFDLDDLDKNLKSRKDIGKGIPDDYDEDPDDTEDDEQIEEQNPKAERVNNKRKAIATENKKKANETKPPKKQKKNITVKPQKQKQRRNPPRRYKRP